MGATWAQAVEAERRVAAAAYALMRESRFLLSESQMARAMGVNRGTVRKALGKL